MGVHQSCKDEIVFDNDICIALFHGRIDVPTDDLDGSRTGGGVKNRIGL